MHQQVWLDAFRGLKSLQVPEAFRAWLYRIAHHKAARFVLDGIREEPLGNVNCVVPSRHSGGANIAFCDAHVQWQSQSRWIAENIAARSRWNNDHQPHPETW